jgi:hypothetical protein
MPIKFSRNHDDEYVEIKYNGQISDSELLSAYKSYFGSNDAIPVLNDLTDLSEADLSILSSDAIQELADYIIYSYKRSGITSFKTAIYAPDELEFGLSRMYVTISYETPQHIKIFKDREKAIQWLRQANISTSG